jgi:hypothetical protein
MITIDLWKDKDFRIKDAVRLCLFEMGIRVPVELGLYLFHLDLKILYDAAFLGMTLIIVRQFGKKELSVILRRRDIPVRYPENKHTYSILVMHPLWFDIMGVLLFLIGWGLRMNVARGGELKGGGNAAP